MMIITHNHQFTRSRKQRLLKNCHRRVSNIDWDWFVRCIFSTPVRPRRWTFAAAHTSTSFNKPNGISSIVTEKITMFFASKTSVSMCLCDNQYIYIEKWSFIFIFTRTFSTTYWILINFNPVTNCADCLIL